jgi:MFS family permease
MTASTAPPQGSFLATGRGRVTLALLCAVTFLDVVDGAIVNVALPTIRAGDLLGRRRRLTTGTALFAASSLACGLADSRGCWSAPGSPRASAGGGCSS